MIRAGSLLYAIYVCLIIGILSGVLIYVFTVNKKLSTRQSVKDQLIDRCDSCFNYMLSSADSGKKNIDNKIDLFDDGLLCQFRKERWGMYSKLIGKAFFKKDTISKGYLIGQIDKNNRLALYMCDFGEELKISGSTEIIGDVKLPKKRYKVVNILGNQQANNPKLRGGVAPSSQELPKIIPPRLIFPPNNKEKRLVDYNRNEQIYNGFDERTIVLYLDKGEKLDKRNIKGNIIIKSKDTIVISNTSIIEDVIIQGPKVIIEKGFIGSLQIYADKEVEVASDVQLRYPSSIVINASNKEYKKKIIIGKDVSIYGGIVIHGSSFRERQNNYITIDEKSIVVGDVYCNGIMELKGRIVGTLYTHKLQLETRSSKYADVILNGNIDVTELPNDFVRLPLFAKTENNRFERVKNIQ